MIINMLLEYVEEKVNNIIINQLLLMIKINRLPFHLGPSSAIN